MSKKTIQPIQYARVCTWEGRHEEENGDTWILFNSEDLAILREALKEYSTFYAHGRSASSKRKKATDLFKRMEDVMIW